MSGLAAHAMLPWCAAGHACSCPVAVGMWHHLGSMMHKSDRPSRVRLQVYDGTDVGLMFKNFYRITGFEDVPCTLVIDPITGAKQLQLNGYVSAER